MFNLYSHCQASNLAVLQLSSHPLHPLSHFHRMLPTRVCDGRLVVVGLIHYRFNAKSSKTNAVAVQHDAECWHIRPQIILPRVRRVITAQTNNKRARRKKITFRQTGPSGQRQCHSINSPASYSYMTSGIVTNTRCTLYAAKKQQIAKLYKCSHFWTSANSVSALTSTTICHVSSFVWKHTICLK